RTDPPPTHSYTLSLHDALPILTAEEGDFECAGLGRSGEDVVGVLHLVDAEPVRDQAWHGELAGGEHAEQDRGGGGVDQPGGDGEDRKSTRLNSSHVKISYAVFC